MREDEYLRRYEAVLELQKQLAARGHFQPRMNATQVSTAFEKQFAGLKFRIDAGVFAPHPSSTRVVDEAVTLTRDAEHPVVVDVGTGCGALAITYALRRPGASVYAVDTAPAAVACARANAQNLGASNVQVFEGSLLQPLAHANTGIDLLIANLPWVAPAIVEVIDLEAASSWRGPRGSVAGQGRDGLDLIRELIRQALPLMRPHAVMIVGVDDWQAPILLRETARDFDVAQPVIPHFVTLRLRPAAELPPAP